MSDTYIQFNEDRSSVKLTHPEEIPGGTLPAIPSKSHAHRLLIAAALSDSPVSLICPVTSRDIEATADCLRAMGAKIERTENGFFVHPVDRSAMKQPGNAELHVGESGSTLRFLLPVLGALGISAEVYMEGRLPERPLFPLDEEMRRHGITLSPQGETPLLISGNLGFGTYTISGGISSQYITGLLLALPLLPEESLLQITGKLESRPYVDITLQVLREFGLEIRECPGTGDVSTVFHIPGGQRYHAASPVCTVEADWSNAAFFLTAGALLPRQVCVTGCNLNSAQGDRAILSLLSEFGAKISVAGDSLQDVSISGGDLHGIRIDAADIPDLVPILSVAASFAQGITTITNIERLRIKESDRVATIIEMIRRIGGNIREDKTPEGISCLIISGTPDLPGGQVDSHNDHRIAMASAIASLRTSGAVTIEGAMAVNKSYPGFYADLEKILN